MTDQPVTIPTCRLCASQGRTTPVFATVSGWVICPICDRRAQPTPTPAQIAKQAKEKP